MRIAFLDAATLGADTDFGPLAKLGELGVRADSSQGELAEILRGKDCAVANRVRFPRAALEGAAAAGLRLIALTATGFNTVDLDAARDLGVAVANVPGYSTESVAQQSVALLLALAGRLPYYARYVEEGSYFHDEASGTPRPMGHFERGFAELAGKAWGVVGLGAIGARVAEIAGALGCRVFWASSSGRHEDPRWERLPLDGLLSRCDVVSLHAPLEERTRGLIGRREIALMKRGAFLVNTGRGPLVDEEALAEALREGRIGGAALDVLAREPMERASPLAPLLGSPRLIVTPHIAWSSVEARNRLIAEVALNIEAFMRGERRNRVD